MIISPTAWEVTVRTPKLVIVGGVAGGATAAARARRISEDTEIVLFERGAYVSFANCGLPYYIGDVIRNRDDLEVSTPENLKARYRIDIRTRTEVMSIDRSRKMLQVLDYQHGEMYEESYDRLILSPGSRPVKPGIPGIDLDHVFTLRDIPDAFRIRGFLEQTQPTQAVVIGGGFIGLEMVENLCRRGIQTTLIEKCGQIMPAMDPEMAAVVTEYLACRGVTAYLGHGVDRIISKTGALGVETDTGKTIWSEMVVLSMGVRPEAKLAREAGIEIGPSGGICVDDTMRTSDPDIFAVGDAVETRNLVTGETGITALAGPANRQGRIAADNALGRKSFYKGSLGTWIVRIFECIAAATGVTEKTLQRLGISYQTSYTHSDSHAKYYPEAKPMAVKMIFSPGDGRILGAQIVGEGGVDKRIDVLATAIHAGMTVHDLEGLELGYAPPFSSAKDPVNISGYVASNIRKEDLKTISWQDVCRELENGSVVIDVRNPDEVQENGKIPGAVVIPLAKLSSRLQELDPSRNYILCCAIGLRGYIAHRMMAQRGFRTRNLSGGLKTHLAGGGAIEMAP
jgi:NADPH-dependent 2,4-dienoyl-CoA reductase/sulfur reductase-like enzyme/rhodanese-related sulfurtransferase